mgnify:CR=1 FL=1
MMTRVNSMPDHNRSNETRLALMLTAVAFATTAGCAFASPDGLHHFDDLSHYLYARWAWTWPGYLLDHWGRPGFTVLYFPTAALGWTACRILSGLLSAATGWFAFRIARRMNLRHAWAAVPLVWLQPLYFVLLQTTLTETPLAFYLALAVLLASRGRWGWSSAVLSAAFVTRHEAILFLPIWLFFAYRAQVSWIRLWPMIWAPAVVNVAAYFSGMTTIIELYLRPKPSNQYGSDGWLTFFARSLHAWGPAVSAMTWAGALGVAGALLLPKLRRFSLTPPIGDSPATHQTGAVESATGVMADVRPRSSLDPRDSALLVIACLVAYFAAQTVIRVFGLFDSGGYARFLVPVGPMAAIMALAAWNGLTTHQFDTRRFFACLTGGAMLLLWASLELQMRYHHGIDIEFPMLKQALIAMRIATPTLMLLAAISAIEFTRPLDFVAARVLPAGLVLMLGLTAFIFIRPLQPPPEAPIVAEAFEALRSKGLGDREIISAVVWLDYVQNRQRDPREPSTRERIEQAPIGTLFAWDKQFAGSPDHKLQLEEFTQSPAFRHVLSTRPKSYATEPYLRIFEKIGPWGPDSASETP